MRIYYNLFLIALSVINWDGVVLCPTDCTCYNSGQSVNCYNKRIGYIPDGISNETIYLDLQLNEIIGLDVPLCQVSPKLQTIYLGNNKISELPVGFLLECYNLERLSLHWNSIYMIELEAFNNMTSLKYLDLRYNNINNLDIALCQYLPQLETLYLLGNLIPEVSNDFFKECRNLQSFSVGRKLSKLDKFTIAEETKLKTLDFSSNDFSEIDKEVFSRLTSLTSLVMDNNPLTYLGYEFLRSSRNLTSLALRGTRTNDTHSFVSGHDLQLTPNLQYLYISRNLLDEIDTELLQVLPKLHYLDLSSNRLSKLNISICQLLPELRYIILDHNQISEITHIGFHECSKLQYISLYNNKLTIIDQFTLTNMTNLQTLYMYNNDISLIHLEAFRGLSSLKHLTLSENPISKNGYGFLRHCGSLVTLDLGNTRNNETHMTINSEDLQNMPNLYWLDLRNNKLEEIEPEFLEKVPGIQYLYLQNKEITTIKANTFHNLDRLYQLNLDGNHITYIENNAFGDLPQLRLLYMNGNPLACNCSIVPFWKWLTARDTLTSTAQCSNGTMVHKIPHQDLYNCNTSIPTVEADLIEGEILLGSLPSLIPIFNCTSGDVTTGQYLFDVYWFVNGDLVSRKENISFEDYNSSVLKEEDWIDTHKMNMEVQCAIRLRFLEEDAPRTFIYSRTYHAGLIPEALEYTVLEGESVNVTFTPTVPVFCFSSHKDFESICDQNIYVFQPNYEDKEATCTNDFSNRDVLFEAEFCGLRLTTKDWKENKNLTVYGFNDGMYNYKGRSTYIRLGTSSVSYGSKIWSDVIIPDIKIVTVDKDTLLMNRLCQIHNDPHIRTFDGRIYDYMEVGEYIMYRNDKGPYMVNVLFTTCGAGMTGPTCNCGVAIRSRNSLFVFRTCQTISKSVIHELQQPVIRQYTCDENDMFIEQSGNSYKIRLPHGTEIKFSRYRFSRFISGISIKPSVYDLDDSKGLCGVPNTIKNPSDDFTNRQNGVVNDWKSFGDSWRVTTEMTSEQLFTENPQMYVISDGLQNEENSTTRHYCACEKQATHTERLDVFYTLHCNLTDTTDSCSINEQDSDDSEIIINPFYTICSDSGFVRRRRSIGSANQRYRRSLTDSDDVVDFSPLSYAEDAFTTNNGGLPTFREGWTYDQAHTICSEAIENACPTELYHDIVDVPTEYFLAACIKDIEFTANTTFLQDTVAAMVTFILTELVRNESLYNQTAENKDQSILEYITNRLCPSNCSGNGTCSFGVCSCASGFIGEDCSQRISTPPTGISLPESGLCAIGNRTCRKTNIFGDFATSAVWCKLKHFSITRGVKVYSSNETITSAEYRNMFMVTVTLPFFRKKRSISKISNAEGFDISLSYDGETFGESRNLIIYNETCYTCDSVLAMCTDLGVCESGLDQETPKDVLDPDVTNSTVGIIIGVIVSSVVFLVIISIIWWYKKKDKVRKINIVYDRGTLKSQQTNQQWNCKDNWMTRGNTMSDLNIHFVEDFQLNTEDTCSNFKN